MDRTRFLDSISKTYQAGIELIRKKNADYASDSDPFRNFRNAEVVGVGVERAILVRVLDKITRIGNLIDQPAKVTDEQMEDTILDAINYLGILKAYRELKTHGPGYRIKEKTLPNRRSSVLPKAR